MKMKRRLFFIAVLVLLIGLSSCATERARDNLPQSTRVENAVFTGIDFGAGADAGEALAGAGSSAIVAWPASERTTFSVRSDGTIVFNLAHQAELTHPIHLGLVRFANEVATRSNGEMIVELHPRVSNDLALLNMVNDNELDAALITIWSVWSNLTDLANLEALPFVFASYEEAWAAYDGTLGEWVTENIIRPNGARVLSYWTNGMRHFTNSVRPIYEPSDMVGLRMRSPQTATHLEMYETLGAAAVTMPFGQVYDALASRSVDGQDNPFGNIHAARLYEVQRYLSLSYHMFSSAPLIVSRGFWYAMTPVHRQILIDSSIAAASFQGELTRTIADNQLQEMRNAGMQVNHINTEAFKAALEEVWAENMARFGNEFATIAARYVSDPTSLAHRFAD